MTEEKVLKMITIRNLSKDWKEFRLKNINLEVKKGEYFVILGPTGAGKTLLLETIAGFYFPDSGEIRIEGHDVTDLPPELRRVGFIYQDYSLFPHLNVAQNIQFGLKLRKTRDTKLVALITKQSRESLELRIGAEIYATFKATSVHVVR